MGKLVTQTLSPVSDADGIAASQTPGGAGNLTLDGALASSGKVTLSNAHIVAITSDANDSGNIFTVTGTDSRDVAITEAVTGPNTTTVQSSKYFKTITQIAIDGAGVGNITVGTNGESVTPWVLFNHGKIIDIGLGVQLSSGATLTYSIEHTFDNIHQNSDISITTFPHGDIVAKTANDDGNYGFPAVAFRGVVTAFTNGSLTFNSQHAF